MIEEMPDGEFMAMCEGVWRDCQLLQIDHDDPGQDGLVCTIRFPGEEVTYRDIGSVARKLGNGNFVRLN